MKSDEGKCPKCGNKAIEIVYMPLSSMIKKKNMDGVSCSRCGWNGIGYMLNYG